MLKARLLLFMSIIFTTIACGNSNVSKEDIDNNGNKDIIENKANMGNTTIFIKFLSSLIKFISLL